ncbi:MAG: TonB-dependent receptor [Rhodothermales bacterium]
MPAMLRLLFTFFTLSLFPLMASAQVWGTLVGSVTDADDQSPIPGATILVDGTNYGTATDEDGRYRLRLPLGPYTLRFSAIGFAPRLVELEFVQKDVVLTLDMALTAQTVEMGGVTVEAEAARPEAGVYTLDPQAVQDIPSPFKDVFRSLKVLPGVATNNELSSQYSVRGGGFNENLIFVNGFEVYLPFRPRQGEQEGIGLLNPSMTSGVTFYTGGFPARYGGKLSSALEVGYRTPEGAVRGSGYLSTLDAGLTAGASALNGRMSWLLGYRKARASRFFETQELKGAYEPDYSDLQASLRFQLNPQHELSYLGIWAEHVFQLDPSTKRTYFGTVSQSPNTPSNLQSLWTTFDAGSLQEDGYGTYFSGLRLDSYLGSGWRWSNDAAYFETIETENFSLTGSSVLYQVDPGAQNPGTGEGQVQLGQVRQQDRADNRVAVQTVTGQSRLRYTTLQHAAEGGIYVRSLAFEDRLDEESVVVGPDRQGNVVRTIADAIQDEASLDTWQAGAYVQDAFAPLGNDQLVVTAGLRADYYDFNDEWTLSPRLSARYLLNDRVTLNGSWGVYYQAPTYRELRGQPEAGETILGALNTDLKSQRSMQFVGGIEYFMAQQRLYARGEVYYKSISNVISYDIDNVRVRYSGENDARAHTYGLDLQIRGEFVPGLESWVNYSYLVAQERFDNAFETPQNAGLVSRPTDQRHTVSIFVADYIPTEPTWKLHMRALYGSGLPYTPPIPGEPIGNTVAQIPGPRFSARYTSYMRFDMGATKSLLITENGLGGQPLTLELTAELLNMFNMINTVAYSWVPDASGIWRRIPTRLTPRTFNVRMTLTF